MWPFSKSYSQADLDRAVQFNVTDILNDYIREASSSADAILAREDIGWQKLTGADGGLTDAQRTANVQLARVYWNLDVICKQLVNLWAYFGVGSGITYRIEGDRDESATKLLDEFMGAKRNQVILSNQGQMRSAIKLLVDGELFRPFFGERDITVRWIDPLQMSIASDPDDKFTPRWYLREWYSGSEQKTAVYRDRDNEADAPGVLSDGKRIEAGDPRIVQDVVVAHTVINTLDLRGNSLLTPVLDWSKAHRRFMRARVAIQQSLARFAAKVTSKGTQSQLTALANKLDSTLGGQTSEDNPPPAAGSIWYENQNTNMQSLKQETGASAAQVDGAMLMQMVGIGAGVFPHYLGAGEAFRLATATAMESPMLRGFETFRSLLHDTYKDDFEYVLAQAGIEDATVQVDSAPVISEETTAAATAINLLLPMFPAFAQSEAVMKRALNVIGVQDAESAIAAMSGAEDEDAPAVPGTQTERAILHRFLRMLQETKGGSGHEGHSH